MSGYSSHLQGIHMSSKTLAVPSVNRLQACISIPITAGAAGIAHIWRQRTGRPHFAVSTTAGPSWLTVQMPRHLR
jgi:hypothetical protein